MAETSQRKKKIATDGGWDMQSAKQPEEQRNGLCTSLFFVRNFCAVSLIYMMKYTTVLMCAAI